MTLSADDLDRLERLAKAATSGPWSAQSYPVIDTFVLSDVDDDGYVCRAILPADGNYIAAANPSVTLALLAEVREGRREREWQPIETAPKDGSGIIAYDPGGTFPNGSLNPPFVGIAAWSEGDGLNEPHWSGPGTPKGHPTHWFKVPSTPATEPER